MPLYEFECKKCGHRFEKMVQSKDDEKATCPKCKAQECQKLISTFSSGSSCKGKRFT